MPENLREGGEVGGWRRMLLGAESQTLVQDARVRAVAAADVAAPVEGAVAALRDALRACAVAAAAAEQLTAVQRGRRAIAGAPRRARGAQASAVRAEVGRFLEIDEVLGGRRLVRGVFRLEAEQFRPRGAVAASVAVEDARGAVEAVAQHVAHGAQRGQAHPARAHRARAGHPVALALLAHLREHGLGVVGGGEQRLSPGARATIPTTASSGRARWHLRAGPGLAEPRGGEAGGAPQRFGPHAVLAFRPHFLNLGQGGGSRHWFLWGLGLHLSRGPGLPLPPAV